MHQVHYEGLQIRHLVVSLRPSEQYLETEQATNKFQAISLLAPSSPKDETITAQGVVLTCNYT